MRRTGEALRAPTQHARNNSHTCHHDTPVAFSALRLIRRKEQNANRCDQQICTTKMVCTDVDRYAVVLPTYRFENSPARPRCRNQSVLCLHSCGVTETLRPEQPTQVADPRKIHRYASKPQKSFADDALRLLGSSG